MFELLKPLPVIGFFAFIGSLFFAFVELKESREIPVAVVAVSQSDEVATVTQKLILSSENLQPSRIAQMTRPQILSLITDLETSLTGTASEQAKLLSGILESVAKENPRNALILAGAFYTLPEIPILERSIFASWAKHDTSSVLDYLGSEATPGRAHHIAISASLFQNEERAKLSEFLDWASIHSAAKNNEFPADNRSQSLFADVANMVGTFVTEETLEEVVGFLGKHVHNPSAAASLSNLLESTLIKRPQTADAWISWLQQFPPSSGDINTMLTVAAIGGLTKHAPDRAAELLSSPEFLNSQYQASSPDETPEQREINKNEFFDQLLDRYIQYDIQYDPEGALESAKAFHDSARREAAEAWAHEIIKSASLEKELE